MAKTVPLDLRANRRWLSLRFGMRTMLVSIALLSVPLGFFSAEMLRLRHLRGVVAKVCGSGGSVSYDYEIRDGSVGGLSPWIQLLRRWFGSDVYAEVVQVKWDYTYSVIDGASIDAAASGLPQVCSVTFIGPKSYESRPPMPWEPRPPEDEVRQFTDRQLAAFGALLRGPNLSHVYLQGGFVTDRHLAEIGDGRNLQSLEVNTARNVSDDGVISISNCRR